MRTEASGRTTESLSSGLNCHPPPPPFSSGCYLGDMRRKSDSDASALERTDAKSLYYQIYDSN